MIQPRHLIPELLDSLPAVDPAALRSRRDLRMINFLMGNERWIMAMLRSISGPKPLRILELGAGDGSLSRKIAKTFPAAEILAFDLQPQPHSNFEFRISWITGDIFAQSPPEREDGLTTVLISNLFLHHFRDEDLPIFRSWFEACDYAFINEPLRSRFAKFLGVFLYPFCNHVTRHDMPASIDAGFRNHELADSMGLRQTTSFKAAHQFPGAYRAIVCPHETH